ncbi:MAG: LysR family transcriptional regulator [Pseudomonadota bacterium]
MNDTELRTFLAIVETGSLVRASKVLNVTQSTVTARLKALESELGQTLINRQKSGATLTPAGVRLRRYATTINDLWRQARQETALPDGFSSVCNIACEPDLWPGLGERLFGFLRRHSPEVAISVWLGSGSEVAEWLTSGKSDLALSYQPHRQGRQTVLELPPDRLVLVSTRSVGPIRFDPAYVFVEAGEEFGRDHAAAYADADTARISFNSAGLGLEHLLRFGGSAYLPHRLVGELLGAGRLHLRPDAPEFNRRIYLSANETALRAWSWFDACMTDLAPNRHKV